MLLTAELYDLYACNLALGICGYLQGFLVAGLQRHLLGSFSQM